MSTVAQDKAFNSEMEGQFEIKMANSALEVAMEWIGKNMSPDEVFSETDLQQWAKDNGWVVEE